MTVYQLIRLLSSFPPHADVQINCMFRDKWADERRQWAVGVRVSETGTFLDNRVEIYGNKRGDK